jgi:Ca2+-binding RTX toxin-like protein
MGTRRTIAGPAIAAFVATTIPLIGQPAEAQAERCLGRRATMVAGQRSNRITGTPRADVIVAKGGADVISSKGGRDRICAGPGGDTIKSGAGADRVSAGPGNDVLLGGKGYDTLKGASGSDLISGDAGNDRMNGGRRTFTDLVLFFRSRSGVSANLARSRARGEGKDRIVGFEGVVGSHQADTLTGNRRSNLFLGLRGRDLIRGGRDTDAVLYVASRKPVRVSLSRGRAIGEGRDRLKDVEAVVGSDRRDALTGSRRRNVLLGGGGKDVINGKGGRDLCIGERARNCETRPPRLPPGGPPPQPQSTRASGVLRSYATATSLHPRGIAPQHSGQFVQCISNYPYSSIHADPGTIFKWNSAGEIAVGSGTTFGDQWVYFRGWIAWAANGQWQYAAGQWIASMNGFHGSFQEYWHQTSNGTFQPAYLAAGGGPTGVAIKGGTSLVSVNYASGPYWVGYEIWWGPFANSAFANPPLGNDGYPHFDWLGQITCPG